jgi:hypothetical protein
MNWLCLFGLHDWRHESWFEDSVFRPNYGMRKCGDTLQRCSRCHRRRVKFIVV